VVRGESHDQTKAFAQYIGDRLRETILQRGPESEIRVLGPAAAPFAKLRGQYRFHLQLQSADSESLRAVVRQATDGLEVPEHMLWTADVDPLDML
jgi:primosomal protein N' (replication factor Y) (superfamily II helicase)